MTNNKYWPSNQVLEQISDNPIIAVTDFKDAKQMNLKLTARVLELEKLPQFTHSLFGVSKVSHVEQWGIPEAELLNKRVVKMVSLLTKSDAVKIKLSWASVYRKGDYTAPHGHDFCDVSVVYMLDPGQPSKQKPNAGQLIFLDPRIEGCCTTVEGVPIQEICADMPSGTMVAFPSPLIHFVHPYLGKRPRITIAWNLTI